VQDNPVSFVRNVVKSAGLRRSPKEESDGATSAQVVDECGSEGKDAEEEGVEGNALSRTEPFGEQVGGNFKDDCDGWRT
jgi:hypothetical protein